MRLALLFLAACGTDGNVLTGVDGSTTNDDSSTTDSPWTALDSGTTTDLFSVWGTGPQDVFAVGGKPGETAGNPGVIVRWTGTSAVTPYLVNLFSVHGRTAVGEYGGEGSYATRSAQGWSSRQVMFAGAIRGTWQPTPSSYACGDNGQLRFSSETGLVGSWVNQTSGTTERLYGIWGSSASNVYVVGANGTILHNTNATGGNGTWTKMTVGSSTLRAVWGSSADDVYIVGEAPAVILRSTNNGMSWTNIPLPASAVGLYGVSGSSASNVYVVGATGGQAFHSTGNGTFTTQMLPSTKDLFGVWVDASGDAFAVGRDGTFVRKPH